MNIYKYINIYMNINIVTSPFITTLVASHCSEDSAKFYMHKVPIPFSIFIYPHFHHFLCSRHAESSFSSSNTASWEEGPHMGLPIILVQHPVEYLENAPIDSDS